MVLGESGDQQVGDEAAIVVTSRVQTISSPQDTGKKSAALEAQKSFRNDEGSGTGNQRI